MARRKKGLDISGWLILDKPVGPTSTDMVNRTRWLLQAKKAGHTGTLDPLASGILPIAFGEATKCVNLLMDAEKVYEFTIRWGAETQTDDAEGDVVQTSEERPSADTIRSALPRFTGTIWQAPPSYSAIKVQGERAYDLARDGQPVDLPEREVDVFELDLIDCPDADHARLRMVCGKGTYVRSLARDLGRVLGCYGHVAELRRSAVGPFHEDGSISLADFEGLCDKRAGQEALSPVETALDDIPALAVTGEQATRLKNGNPVRVLNFTSSDDQTICVMHDRKPVALARYRDEWVEPVRVFNL